MTAELPNHMPAILPNFADSSDIGCRSALILGVYALLHGLLYIDWSKSHQGCLVPSPPDIYTFGCSVIITELALQSKRARQSAAAGHAKISARCQLGTIKRHPVTKVIKWLANRQQVRNGAAATCCNQCASVQEGRDGIRLCAIWNTFPWWKW